MTYNIHSGSAGANSSIDDSLFNSLVPSNLDLGTNEKVFYFQH